jgi:hypothetical protein
MDFLQALSLFEIDCPLTKQNLKKEYQRLVEQNDPRYYHTYQEQIWASNRLIRLHEAYQYLIQQPWNEVPLDMATLTKGQNGKSRMAWAAEPSAAVSSLFQLGTFLYEKLMLFLCGTPNCSGLVGYTLMGVGILAAIHWLPYIYLVFLFVYLIAIYIKIQGIFLRIGSWLIRQDLRPSVPTAGGQLAYLSIVTLVACPLVYLAYQLTNLYPFDLKVWEQCFSRIEQLAILGGGVVFLITFYEWLSGIYAMCLRLWIRYRLRGALRLAH